MIKNVLITGGNGLIGSHLQPKLKDLGYQVAVLSREPAVTGEVRQYQWDPAGGSIDMEAIRWADAIIHLAGAGIADSRWTARRKQLIRESRVQSGNLLFQSLKSETEKLQLFIGASAIGYYGAVTTDTIFEETDPPGTDFQGITCKEWEAASHQIQALGVRTAITRVGVVLSPQGGALQKMALPVRLFVGSPLGTGKQAIPWIHIDDLCNVFLKILEDPNYEGTFNAVAPEQVNNRMFTQTLSRVLHRPMIFPPVPAFILKLILGEMAEIVLEGSRVSSEKLLSAGFKFQYPKLDKALVQLMRK